METLGIFLFNVLALLVTLGILVTFHEYGHFWVARRCGVKVERFSIGFGKPIFRWRGRSRDARQESDAQPEAAAAVEAAEAKAGAVGDRQNDEEDRDATEFVIAALPLGGYVKMYGEPGQSVPRSQRHKSFIHQPLANRTAIVAAGPLANFLLAIVLYWFMFMIGVSGVAPVVGEVEAGSPAALVGIQPGDEIVEVDGEATRTWQEVNVKLLERLGESGSLSLALTGADSSLRRSVTIPLERWLINEAEPDTMASLGLDRLRLDIPPRIGEIIPGGRAESAGLQPGDLITSVNGAPLSGWLEWVDIVRANAETPLRVGLERDGQSLQLSLRPAAETISGGEVRGVIGAGVEQPETWPAYPDHLNRSISYSPLASIPRAVAETWNNSLFVLDAVKKMVLGLISLENLSGPITIAQVAGQTASYGLEYFIGFLAILSISLGILNLLPIPLLDGGHLFYYAIEAVIRRPVPLRVQEMGMRIGLLIIAGIMCLAFYNDINRLL